ncbi:type III PLP-dependent enzyme [Anaerotalea alkaliphila]|uniref:ornithine decarboxylase n=1 Tax=Anaerotalea alkaliphila TaxID=2662126 RepID=A0A7X5KMU3_9FIRM|nr:type III PLP-dependent enzyme [Anaerotalea alkaliphila]NDL68194.1 type III PLP-dependent enzyme [Anaerotalea alkaliphila]
MKIERFISTPDWEKVKEFSVGKETPFLVVNVDTIKKNYQELKEHFEHADIYYAVKANPRVEVLEALRDKGSSFDAASIYELDRLFSIGVEPSRISYGNTIKKSAHIRYAYEKGIRLFATDSESDLRNISEHAPGSRVFIRMLVEGALSADWPLARKFGCNLDEIRHLISLVREEKLDVQIYGLSFHVGSQQRNIMMWDYALLKAKDIFDWALEEEGIQLEMINMGGGFPSNYVVEADPIGTYAAAIEESLDSHFYEKRPRIILEPGRSMVGNAGVLVSEVVLVSKKSHFEHYRWVYLDVGKFNGLIETLDECIKYPVFTDKEEEEKEEVIMAGPTCDSMDIMYEDHKVSLPLSLREGDKVYWLTTGAYTSSYCAVEFNGFPPMKTYCI